MVKITGQDLYTVHEQEWALRNTGIESWHDLTPGDRVVWEATADRLGERVIRFKGEPLPEIVGKLRIISPTGKDVGSFEEVIGGVAALPGQTLGQAVTKAIPSGFYAVAPRATAMAGVIGCSYTGAVVLLEDYGMVVSADLFSIGDSFTLLQITGHPGQPYRSYTGRSVTHVVSSTNWGYHHKERGVTVVDNRFISKTKDARQ
jgi:hypothetical protein